ncbi:hypothetical protein THIX_90102 [Thiomonas sp. X19]|nr:hypothetical protein THIX_90102 [Thiomonas sp. X19]
MQALDGLSDDPVNAPIRGRLSFMRFWGWPLEWRRAVVHARNDARCRCDLRAPAPGLHLPKLLTRLSAGRALQFWP